MATVKSAIDSIASDIVSWATPVETPNASFTADSAGMNRWSESGPMKVTEMSAMKKYQRGRKGVVIERLRRAFCDLTRRFLWESLSSNHNGHANGLWTFRRSWI